MREQWEFEIVPSPKGRGDDFGMKESTPMIDHDTCDMYLVRHGATENNLARPPRLQGRRIDLGLSAVGLEQAARTAEFLAGQGVEAVFASPLVRARQTAEQIARRIGAAVSIVEELTEIDVGDWEGLSWAEIERRAPEPYRLFMADAGVHPYLGGENMAAVQARTAPAIAELLKSNLGRRIAVVAHNVVNRVYLADLLGLSPGKYRAVPQDNCGVNLVRLRGEKISLITVNAVGHLLDTRPTCHRPCGPP
jgi:broad specificity phosphatase PhoE